MCFVWISEQTAIISLYNMTGLYKRDGVCLLRGTDWVFIYNSAYAQSLEDKFLSRQLCCFLSISFHQWSIFTFNYLLHLPQGEREKSGNLQNSNVLENRGALDREAISSFLSISKVNKRLKKNCGSENGAKRIVLIT
jgi:hypothetical protein